MASSLVKQPFAALQAREGRAGVRCGAFGAPEGQGASPSGTSGAGAAASEGGVQLRADHR